MEAKQDISATRERKELKVSVNYDLWEKMRWGYSP